MIFQTAIADLKQFLSDNALGAYSVVGYGKQAKNAEAIGNNLPLVQVFHGGGTFSKANAPINGIQEYTPSIIVRITVAEPSDTDLSVLDDPDSTTEERILAIAESTDAEQRAADRLDTVFAHLFNLIMGYRGMKFGKDSITFTDRFGEDFRVELPQKKGSLAVINGYYAITIKTRELPQEQTGLPLEHIDHTTVADNATIRTTVLY